jgi:transposase
MPRHAVSILLSDADRARLESIAQSGKSEQRAALRSKVILAAAAGLQDRTIASELGVTPMTVAKWRSRFRTAGLDGLLDSPRSGRPRIYTVQTERRILAVLDKDPPPGYTAWTGGLISNYLGDVDDQQVWKVLKKRSIHLSRRRSWCISTDPEFGPKAADIVGLYLSPPENAVVLCVDEKPNIQALERAQGYLKLPNGRAVTGFSHEYKRHGTSNLFTALNVATGTVRAGHYNRKRRVEFLDFMEGILAEYPDRQVHVVLDNYSTHNLKNDKWLAKQTNVHFHYTPTHASWLNQVEVWFSILWRNVLRGASFTSPAQLTSAIDAFIEVYNQTAHPFHWTKTHVKPKGLANKYTELRD